MDAKNRLINTDTLALRMIWNVYCGEGYATPTSSAPATAQVRIRKTPSVRLLSHFFLPVTSVGEMRKNVLRDRRVGRERKI